MIAGYRAGDIVPRLAAGGNGRSNAWAASVVTAKKTDQETLSPHAKLRFIQKMVCENCALRQSGTMHWKFLLHI